jgi:hypothetical protein
VAGDLFFFSGVEAGDQLKAPSRVWKEKAGASARGSRAKAQEA